MEHPFGSRVGGATCLDFVNTVRAWAPAPDGEDTVVDDRIASYDALVAWGGFVELLTHREARALRLEASRHPARGAAVVRRAHALRAAIYGCCKRVIADGEPRARDLATINDELQLARAHERLAATPAGLTLALADLTSALDGLLWPVVRSTVEVLTGPQRARVGQCPGDDCGWMFLDTSRGGRRQWCDMKVCGNVAKVRRFRERT